MSPISPTFGIGEAFDLVRRLRIAPDTRIQLVAIRTPGKPTRYLVQQDNTGYRLSDWLEIAEAFLKSRVSLPR